MTGREVVNTMVAILILLLIMMVLEIRQASAQDLTYCENAEGEVYIVTDYTCKPGDWEVDPT